jgi:hypothetical protein
MQGGATRQLAPESRTPAPLVCRIELRRGALYKSIFYSVRSTEKQRKKAPTGPVLNAAIEAFEPHFLDKMVLALDSYFVHRARAMETKDGSALNEVGTLCNSMINNNSRMCVDKTIKYDRAKSV